MLSTFLGLWRRPSLLPSNGELEAIASAVEGEKLVNCTGALTNLNEKDSNGLQWPENRLQHCNVMREAATKALNRIHQSSTEAGGVFRNTWQKMNALGPSGWGGARKGQPQMPIHVTSWNIEKH